MAAHLERGGDAAGTREGRGRGRNTWRSYLYGAASRDALCDLADGARTQKDL